MTMKSEVQSVPWLAPAHPGKVLDNGKRLDGRALEEFRPVFFKTDVISQAPGSVYAEHGTTKLMVAVYGPRAPDRRTEFSETGRVQCDFKLATFATAVRGQRSQTPEERDMSLLMRRALEPSVQCDKFPKAVVDVYVTVLESGGSDLAVSISAASVAMAMAGIELFDLVAACRLSMLQAELLLDSSVAEEQAEDGSMTLALMPQRQQVTQMITTGEWSSTRTEAGLDLLMAGCTQLDATMRATIRESRATAVM